MAFSRLNKRGQTSVEFLFLFLIMLIYVNTIVYPNMYASKSYIEETHKLGQARLAIKQIANAVTEVAAASGESKQTFYVFLDENIDISCNDSSGNPRNTIQFDVPLKVEEAFQVEEAGIVIGECTGDVCTGRELVSLPSGTTLNCSGLFPLIKGSEIKKVKIVIWKEYQVGGAQINVQATTP